MKNCRCERCMKKNRHEEERKWYPEYEEKGYRKERNYDYEQFEKSDRHEDEKKWYPEYEENGYQNERNPEYERFENSERHGNEKKWYPEYEEKECDKGHEEDHGCKEGYGKIKTIYECPVYCLSEEHFHHRVRHIVPVIYKKVENHHTHHEYIVKKEFKKVHKEHEHGKKENQDWCRFGHNKECKDRRDYK